VADLRQRRSLGGNRERFGIIYLTVNGRQKVVSSLFYSCDLPLFAFSASLEGNISRSKRFFSAQSDFFSAQYDFSSLKAIFTPLNSDFTRSKQFSPAQDDFHALDPDFHLQVAVFRRSKRFSHARSNSRTFKTISGWTYRLPLTVYRRKFFFHSMIVFAQNFRIQ
jgi:hypothetical protein